MTTHWLIEGDSKSVLKKIKGNSVHLAVTSPPYFNARDYSQWPTLTEYLEDMRSIFNEVFRILDNHRVFVLNVGDVQCRLGKQPWTTRRLPLGAFFVVICTQIGFEYVDDYIWDKGEPQSYRHMNGGNSYPFYQYPVNCYEHLLVFHKHVRDMTRLPCPICRTPRSQNNSRSEIGVQSWECNNEHCDHRSPGNRGKRYSARSIMMDRGKTPENFIPKHLSRKWRRDIVGFSPVMKWYGGKNIHGHDAPFPEDIPEMAIRFFSYKGETVVDPFAGSFTTSVVALKTGRNSIGIDINHEFVELGKKRLGVTDRQITLLGGAPEFVVLDKAKLDHISSLDIPKSKIWDKEIYFEECRILFQRRMQNFASAKRTRKMQDCRTYRPI